MAAVIANEERMIEAYKNGEDLHRQTASHCSWQNHRADITKEDRQLAKAVNFGLLYGQSAKGLVAYAKKAYGVEMDYDRARAISTADSSPPTRDCESGIEMHERWPQKVLRACERFLVGCSGCREEKRQSGPVSPHL